MARRSAEQRETVRQAFKHPVDWFKGRQEPEENVHPWEMGFHVISGAFSGFRNGFAWNVLSMFQNVFKVTKNQLSVASVVTGAWDGINDPIIGSVMDNKNLPVSTHKKLMRVNAIAGLLTVTLFFDFGLSTWQHVILYIIVNSIHSLFSTVNSVSSAKVWAHITPYSQQRSKIAAASAFGQTLHEALGGLIWVLLGLREVLGIQEYHIYLVGIIVSTIPCLLTDMLPSFVLQRVPDKKEPPKEKRNFFADLKESFLVVRHNKYFVLQMLASFITTFTPSVGDNDFYRYCGVTETIKAGKINGELIMWLRSNVASAPGVILQPFSLGIMKKMGGARASMIFYQAVLAVCGFARTIIGVKSIPRLMFLWGTEVICWTLGKVDAVANNVVKYDMMDYVEWKTGRRSEGVTMAVEGIVKKVAINNFNTVIGNLFASKVGFDARLFDQGKPQPESYLRWANLLYLLCPAIDATIFLIARLLYKYPDDQRAQVEADLIERRALAQEMEKAVVQE